MSKYSNMCGVGEKSFAIQLPSVIEFGHTARRPSEMRRSNAINAAVESNGIWHKLE